MAWGSYIEYEYPVTYNFEKLLVWASVNFKCYFALKEKSTDAFTYYAGDNGHDFLTGKVLSQYSVESEARTNYLNGLIDYDGKVVAVFPTLFTARYVRIYINNEQVVNVYEFRPSTQVLADEIITGKLQITDDFNSPPMIMVTKSGITRIVIGNYEGTSYGLVGYDSGSSKLFELSDTTQEIIQLLIVLEL